MSIDPVGRSGWRRLGENTDILIVLGVILIVVMMVIPLPPFLIDLLLVFNIGISLLILLLTMNLKEPLELAIFPSILLVATLLRMALNVSTSRLILLHAYAGEMVQAFGHFVVGGNYVVGFVVFLILVVIQFMVITKGAERVAEVAARFTLDAMPGKQMSIDADLNAGLIDDQEARRRRRDVEREADFYGAMDGASKFVKGDAIAGIVITLINILGGFAVGVGQRGFALEEALRRYTLLTVGDGLVTQIPALLVSTATGIIITRAASEGNLGAELGRQLFSSPKVLGIGSGVLCGFGLVPGLPTTPFMLFGLIMAAASYGTLRAERVHNVGAPQGKAEEAATEAERGPEDVSGFLQVDPVELEIGYSLIPLVDAAQGGDLLERVTLIRRQLAQELGMVVPAIRIRDNMQLNANEYVVRLHGGELSRAQIWLGQYLAMDSGGVTEKVPGEATKEPAFGLPALWIDDTVRDDAELAGYTVVDPPTVVATHLSELLRTHAAQLLSRQDVKRLVDGVREEHSAVVEELIPDHLTLGEVHRVLQALLREGVPIRNLVLILEVLADAARITRDQDTLVEYVREGLARQISQLYVNERGVIAAVTLDPALEQEIGDAIERTDRGVEVRLPARYVERFFQRLASVVEQAAAQGQQPVILCSPHLRLAVRRLIERALPRIPVLSYREVQGSIEVHSVGMVSLSDAS